MPARLLKKRKHMNNRFRMADTGIAWDVKWPTGIPHSDHLEMSGRAISVILRWTVDSRCCLRLVRQVYWPGSRSRPDDVRGYLCREFADDIEPAILINGVEERMVALKIARIEFDGTFRVVHHAVRGLRLERCLFPSTHEPCLVERWTLTNVTDRPFAVALGAVRYERTSGYRISVRHDQREVTLAPGESVTDSFCITTGPVPDAAQEESRRRARIAELARVWVETPEPVLNRLFQMSALRAGEALFDTPRGLVHSPGGGDFYGGVWANDQIEYTAPWFGWAGDAAAVEATRTACRLFAGVMPADGTKMPGAFDYVELPANPGGDRGDAAMYLSGTARFLLGLGDAAVARELWPALVWTAEYCQRQTNAHGVIASDCDELERRFPTGDANLTTSCLAYDGYRHAALLARDLGHSDWERRLTEQANALGTAIEKHFGAGDTYRYFDGCNVLRGWLCMPLTVGLDQRAAGTTRALLSPAMLTEEGIRTQAGAPTVWDRTTLYALKGMILTGHGAEALPVLLRYSHRRLLGDHVPYPWECELGQVHLAAESALFCRLVVEGLFGVRHTGLGQIVVEPRLPDGWPGMALRGVVVGGVRRDLVVERTAAGVVRVINETTSWNHQHSH
jgi:hypothetical protein